MCTCICVYIWYIYTIFSLIINWTIFPLKVFQLLSLLPPKNHVLLVAVSSSSLAHLSVSNPVSICNGWVYCGPLLSIQSFNLYTVCLDFFLLSILSLRLIFLGGVCLFWKSGLERERDILSSVALSIWVHRQSWGGWAQEAGVSSGSVICCYFPNPLAYGKWSSLNTNPAAHKGFRYSGDSGAC